MGELCHGRAAFLIKRDQAKRLFPSEPSQNLKDTAFGFSAAAELVHPGAATGLLAILGDDYQAEETPADQRLLNFGECAEHALSLLRQRSLYTAKLDEPISWRTS